MKLPRNLSGRELAQRLSVLGYEVTRQKGSHMRLTTELNGVHHVTVPSHDPLKIGTLSAIIGDIARHFGVTKSELAERLFES
jgi:predicted RNA binding protein YcfA (HicA-like mRNA interferase family)